MVYCTFAVYATLVTSLELEVSPNRVLLLGEVTKLLTVLVGDHLYS